MHRHERWEFCVLLLPSSTPTKHEQVWHWKELFAVLKADVIWRLIHGCSDGASFVFFIRWCAVELFLSTYCVYLSLGTIERVHSFHQSTNTSIIQSQQMSKAPLVHFSTCCLLYITCNLKLYTTTIQVLSKPFVLYGYAVPDNYYIISVVACFLINKGDCTMAYTLQPQ